MNTILKLENIHVIMSDNLVLSVDELNIPKGQLTCVVGKSGAGKSTLLKAIVKLIPSEGKITLVNGEHDISVAMIDEFRKKVTYLPQTPSMFPGSVEDNLRISYRLKGISDQINLNELKQVLKEVNLDAISLDQKAEDLSGGEKQRLALARTLIGKPGVLLLDEPTSSLDPITKKFFDEQIKGLLKSDYGLSLVMITHSLHQMMNIADHIVILHEGKLIKSAPIEEIFGSEEDRNKVLQKYDEAQVLDKLTKGDYLWH